MPGWLLFYGFGWFRRTIRVRKIRENADKSQAGKSSTAICQPLGNLSNTRSRRRPSTHACTTAGNPTPMDSPLSQLKQTARNRHFGQVQPQLMSDPKATPGTSILLLQGCSATEPITTRSPQNKLCRTDIAWSRQVATDKPGAKFLRQLQKVHTQRKRRISQVKNLKKQINTLLPKHGKG